MINNPSASYRLRRTSLLALAFVLTLLLLSTSSLAAQADVGSERQANESITWNLPTARARAAASLSVPATDTITSTLHLPLVTQDYASILRVVAPREAWTADWWLWIQRVNSVPIGQQGSVDCGLGQTGDLWFLAGTDGYTPVVRSCVVPPDKTFLVPLQTIAWFNEGSENLTVPEKRAVLNAVFSDEEPGPYNTRACRLESSVDGEPVDNVQLQSPTFLYATDPEAVADGYWIAVRVPDGTHVVKVHGALCDWETNVPINDVNVTYTLEVDPNAAFVGEPWQMFVWDTTVGPIATGCSPQDPTGVLSCDVVTLGRNSNYAATPPWLYTAPAAGALLTVVDIANSGDEFEVFDNEVSIGVTSPAQDGIDCSVPTGGDPGVCVRQEGMSSGEFMLGPGDHSLTIKPVKGFDFGVGYFRIEPMQGSAVE